MEPLSIRDFRSNMASSFNRVAQGENVLIRRNKEIYALVKVGREDLTVTPELQARIDEARRAYERGESISCSSHEELSALLNSL